MKKFQAPEVPYVQAHNVNSKHRPSAIVLHLSWTTSEQKASLGIANRLHSIDAPANSHHYMVDECEIYRGVWDNFGAAGSPKGALSVLICGQPQEHVELWDESPAKEALEMAANLVGDLILAYKIQPRWLDEESEARWKKRRTRRRGGIMVNIPGVWPKDTFMLNVQSRINQKIGV